MEKTILGRTELEITVAGLGCGGHSHLGLESKGEKHAASLVRAAYDAGVNFFDTATLYGTQGVVGEGLKDIPRDKYVLSSKFPSIVGEVYNPVPGILSTPKQPGELMKTLEESLRLLRTDYIDIYSLHGITYTDYEMVRDIFYPELQKAKQQGKIRFISISEFFQGDTTHEMLKKCLPENLFDVIMVGYNLLNHSAAKTVLPLAAKNNTGVICMFAVRSALSNPQQLKVDLRKILANNQGGYGLTDSINILDFLMADADDIIQAAYRFCRHTTGIHTTLTGTGNLDHLMNNLRSISMPALSDKVLKKIDSLFGNVDCFCGQ